MSTTGSSSILPLQNDIAQAPRLQGIEHSSRSINTDRLPAKLNLNHLSLPENAFKEDNVKNEARAGAPQEGNTTEGDGSGIDNSLLGAGAKQAEDGKTAFGHLVLPPGHKEMVTSLVTQHFRDKASGGNTDIVRGKGACLVL